MKRVAILGSTGSVGTQTLDVVRAFPSQLKAVSLVAYSNVQRIKEQAQEFCPEFVGLVSRDGEQCLVDAVKNCDVAVVATRGTLALRAVVFCLEHGIDVALANKETLVCGGELVLRAACQGGGKILPVDSEHSAIEQCLLGHDRSEIDKILLTASGGPFWDLPEEQLHFVKSIDALKHPTWHMGAKITVDSATLMNKVLEVVEAHFLFGVPPQNVQIVVHRQSVVHSMVQWKDGSVTAQLAVPDMRLPIEKALLNNGTRIVDCVDFEKLLTLTFEKCNFEKFPCARFAEEICDFPPLCRTVMNSANDVCVESFLNGSLPFDGFYPTILACIEHFAPQTEGLPVTLQNIRRFDGLARDYTQKSLLR